MKEQRRGLARLVYALRYALEGQRATWKDEEAFREIVLLCMVGVPLGLYLGSSWAERVLLIVPLVLCVVVELLNTAIENVVDLVSPEWHPLAKKAKDMGSAAQFVCQIFLACVWLGFLIALVLE